jgi:Uma2 family endonuclease
VNVRAHIKVDKGAFFRFIEQQAEGRFEYEEGRIVQQMTGGTRRHAAIAQRFISVLERQLDPAKWLVTGHTRGVDTGRTVRYADVVVEQASDTWDDLSTDAASLLVEVLSPSTQHLDLNVKPPEYMGLPLLEAYIAASQDEPCCWAWLRAADGGFPELPHEIAGLDRLIAIPGLALSIPLEEIYRGIVHQGGQRNP